jgi:hypothetical protein
MGIEYLTPHKSIRFHELIRHITGMITVFDFITMGISPRLIMTAGGFKIGGLTGAGFMNVKPVFASG